MTWKTNYNAEKCASDVKKRRIVVNRISKVRQTACNWIKKILDEATIIIVNVFLISWFFYLFLSCSEAWVNTIRASSFIENFPQISAKPIAFQRNLLGKLPRKSAVLQRIPAKIPQNRPFFPRICPWKSHEIWLFFPRPTRSPGYAIAFSKMLLCY